VAGTSRPSAPSDCERRFASSARRGPQRMSRSTSASWSRSLKLPRRPTRWEASWASAASTSAPRNNRRLTTFEASWTRSPLRRNTRPGTHPTQRLLDSLFTARPGPRRVAARPGPSRSGTHLANRRTARSPRACGTDGPRARSERRSSRPDCPRRAHTTCATHSFRCLSTKASPSSRSRGRRATCRRAFATTATYSTGSTPPSGSQRRR
jgi:hypothetical protein